MINRGEECSITFIHEGILFVNYTKKYLPVVWLYFYHHKRES